VRYCALRVRVLDPSGVFLQQHPYKKCRSVCAGCVTCVA
jgi:hypothetical protein